MIAEPPTPNTAHTDQTDTDWPARLALETS